MPLPRCMVTSTGSLGIASRMTDTDSTAPYHSTDVIAPCNWPSPSGTIRSASGRRHATRSRARYGSTSPMLGMRPAAAADWPRPDSVRQNRRSACHTTVAACRVAQCGLRASAACAVRQHQRVVLIVRHADDRQIRQTLMQRLQFERTEARRLASSAESGSSSNSNIGLDHKRARQEPHAAAYHPTIARASDAQRRPVARASRHRQPVARHPSRACGARATRKPRYRTQTDAGTTHSSETASQDCAGDAAAHASGRDRQRSAYRTVRPLQ